MRLAHQLQIQLPIVALFGVLTSMACDHRLPVLKDPIVPEDGYVILADDVGMTKSVDGGVEDDLENVVPGETGALEKCGNAQLDEGEYCDVALTSGEGLCPTACNDNDASTDDKLVGQRCQAHCEFTPIVDCLDDDGFCPEACDDSLDNDCGPSCGNGLLDAAELCDIAIADGLPGACPTTCNDGSSCTMDEVVGTDCDATCSNVSIEVCDLAASDGCCAAGCDATNDADCSPTCGNGTIEAGETCETTIPLGSEGACPTSCDDSNLCTVDTLVGSLCGQSCSNVAITQCDLQSDGCCPAGCDSDNDSDCLPPPPACGNGVVDSGEKCDTALSPGTPGACPTSCNDGNACTVNSVVGSLCDQFCGHIAITACDLQTDGCCPAGCDATNDGDCMPSCGNGIVEAGELCDGANYDGKTCQTEGFDAGSLSCSPTCDKMRTNGCSKCGNGVVETGELCDGSNFAGKTCQTEGYDAGSLSCSPDCTKMRTNGCSTCGNGIVESGEACDGTNFGGKTCQTEGFGGGSLSCASDCSAYRTGGCTR
jgi:hypothetical protein